MKLKALLLSAAILGGTAACDESPVEPRPAYDGRFTITFDDGWESVWSRGLPALKANGLRGNVAVITESVDYWDGFLTLAQLQDLHEAGWSLVSHTVSHDSLTKLSDADLERELIDSKAWLQANGFNGSSVFVVPYHDFGERELAAIRRHYSAARIANASYYVPAHFENWRPDDPYRLTSLEAEYAPYTTEEGRATLIAQVEEALEAGKFVDVLFHDIPEAHNAAFQATIAALARFKSVNAPYHVLFEP